MSGQDTEAAPGRRSPIAGQRIAKLLARAGVGSRREVERMIAAGRVAIAGRPVTSPAVRLVDLSGVTVDGRPVRAPEPVRLWRLYKPRGVLTARSDPRGRRTLSDILPPELAAVKPIGRLDLNSEGLLLLTNDGELKRLFELPATGVVRRYRVRVHGRLEAAGLARLEEGIEIAGERFRPMEVTLERSGRSNHWLLVSLREGRNREIRRAFAAIGLEVNRLIRLAYGPITLGRLKPGELAEVPQKTLLLLVESLPGGAPFARAIVEARGWRPARWARARPQGSGHGGAPGGKPGRRQARGSR